MSKKQTRRAAREAFPKAKTPPPKRGAYGQRPQRRAGRAPGAPKPASIRRAAITGIIMAFLYFVVIQWLWKNETMTTLGNVVVAFIGFLIFTGVVYGMDHFKYRRYLRKKGLTK